MVKFTGDKLLIATRNEGKIQELTSLLQPLGLKLSTARDLDIPDPDETGQTFEENALIKARAYMQASGLPALADDSGMCIDAMGGFPGIDTAPFAQQHGGHVKAAQVLAERLEGKDKSASFCTCIVLMLPTGDYQAYEARVQGHLVFPPRGNQNWGFDPIFIPSGETRTYGEMPSSEKIQNDHRALALKKILDACF